jgi:hypothetical protein
VIGVERDSLIDWNPTVSDDEDSGVARAEGVDAGVGWGSANASSAGVGTAVGVGAMNANGQAERGASTTVSAANRSSAATTQARPRDRALLNRRSFTGIVAANQNAETTRRENIRYSRGFIPYLYTFSRQPLRSIVQP